MAFASMAIYAIAVGCYIALMLLVISMEEGSSNLANATYGLTLAVVLLSEGSGFKTGSITLTITPLLLTIMLIWLIGAVVSRCRKTNVHVYAAGLITWLAMNEFMRSGISVGLVDDQWLVLGKAALIFSLGYAGAIFPYGNLTKNCLHWYRQHVPTRIRHSLNIGMSIAAVITGIYLVVGLITVVVWAVLNHAAVFSVFSMSGMETGSRITTSLAMLIWLPNLALWAVSWLFGAGFAIGDLANFTLWVGQSNGLPAVPLFAIFPEPISNDIWRMAALAAPLTISCIVGLVTLFIPQGFRYRPINVRHVESRASLMADLAYSVASFCLAAGLISLAFTALFALSNGSLGEQRLAQVGVNVMASTRAVGHATAIGLSIAWLVALISTALVFSIVWITERIRNPRSGNIPHNNGTTERRTIVSQSPQSKEEQE
ncbi:cell division protein PerM [Bifidobacterium scaligerum]|uniref:cell division protein PerM n=1 Tax=Bifidobacterium scaligerum TaxID=2052656 RepID=UPI001FAF7427|nr:DUF6350 family protein [Bifidobacterium scaligerum]